MFNNEIVNCKTVNKHLVMILDSNLRYDENVNSVLSKISKTIAVVRKS